MNCSLKRSDYNSDNIYTWCTNCGNYGIHGALKDALLQLEIPPHESVLCFDIGCHGNGSDKIAGYNVHGLHGRIIPFATGAALANDQLTVIASAGDGATLGEGINHLVHAIRSNYNITFLLHNNMNYGLTTGQASPTTPEGFPMNSSPDGVTADPMNVLDFVFSLSPTFVARGFSGEVRQLTRIIKAGVQHKGFSFIEILQDCPTYNDATPHGWYLERVYDINSQMNYSTADFNNARRVASDIKERIATGILYVDQSKPDFLARNVNREGVDTQLVEEVKSYSVDDLLDRYR